MYYTKAKIELFEKKNSSTNSALNKGCTRPIWNVILTIFNFKNYFHCSNTKLTRFAFHFLTCASIIQIRSVQRWIFELDVLGG